MNIHNLSDEEIGALFRIAREARKVRQEDIADHIGMTKQGYSLLEKGYNSMKVTTAFSIAEYLKMTISDILLINNYANNLSDSEIEMIEILRDSGKELSGIIEQLLTTIKKEKIKAVNQGKRLRKN